MSEHGVRYVVVRVDTTRTHGIDGFDTEVEKALRNHRVLTPASSAPLPAFGSAKVTNVMLGYQYDMMVQHMTETGKASLLEA